jgi:uncharacterized membrane protein YqjE
MNTDRVNYPIGDAGDRSIGSVINDMKEEMKEFVSTRFEMFRVEMNDRIAAYKTAVPALLIAAVLGWFAFGILTAALVAWIATAFESEYRVFLAALIVGVIYAIGAGLAAWYGMAIIRNNKLMPERTINVLKQDQAALQHVNNTGTAENDRRVA